MKKVPYVSNPGNACALSCYTMAAQYLFPKENITFEQLGKISKWKPGYVVWEFPAFKWLMDKGASITFYDPIDYHTWAKEGIEGLRKSIPPHEFKFFKEHTYDLDEVGSSVKHALEHPKFTFKNYQPTWQKVLAEFQKPGVCDLVLNLKALNHEEGFAAHRVVITDIMDDEIVFHDPNKAGTGENRREPLDHFRNVFESIKASSLTRYSLDQ